MKTSQSGSSRRAVQIIVAAGVALGAAPAVAQNLFLEISDPKIAGESTDKAHKDWIEIESYQHYFPEKVCSQIYLTKRLDKASVLLAEHSATQRVIRKAKLAAVRYVGDGEATEYLILEIQGAFLSDFAMSLSGEGGGYESLAITPSFVKMTYKPVNPNTGMPGAPVEKTFNCATGATR